MATNSILVIEDDEDIQELLRFALGRAGFQVTTVGDAESALEQLEGKLPNLILIDWMLPGMSGIELARRVRRDSVTKDLPLIMLTARGEEADKLQSFESGLDDYVTKPFSTKELIARIKALLRRTGIPEDGNLTINSLNLNMVAHSVSVEGTDVYLRPTEFRLLELFMRYPKRAFHRSQLLDIVWGPSVYVDERTVDVHVLRLRKALMPHDLEHLVQTVRGVGYRLNPDYMAA